MMQREENKNEVKTMNVIMIIISTVRESKKKTLLVGGGKRYKRNKEKI